MDSFKQICDYIHQLYRTEDFVPLSVPVFCGNEKKYLEECIDSTFVSSVGPFVDLFEKRIAEYTQSRKAVVCVNGTNALHLALLLVDTRQEDEVLVQPLTFIATCNAISYIGAHPVFIDVDKDTLGLSPFALRTWLKANAEIKNNECRNKYTGRRIKACVPMHTFGHPVKIEAIKTICEEWHIELIEDAAESIGSLYKGKHTGTFGKIGVLSFNGNKTITTGGGLGCAQLENLDKFIQNKRQTAQEYAEYFAGFNDPVFFSEPQDCRSNYWLNTLIFKDHDAQQAFLEYSNSHKVMTRPAWELMNRLPMFKNCQKGNLENAEWLADRIVNIPSSVNL